MEIAVLIAKLQESGPQVLVGPSDARVHRPVVRKGEHSRRQRKDPGELELELDTKRWGVPQISALGGSVKTKEKLGLTFEIVAQRRVMG